MQSTCIDSIRREDFELTTVPAPLHVAIIMDGNGRWATARGYPRTRGHRQGARTVRDIVTAAARSEIDTLTLYAFSADNWKRPGREVQYLMHLFRRYLAEETKTCIDNGVRLEVIGRRDRLDECLCDAIRAAEFATRCGDNLHLRIAIDYSGRAAIVQASQYLWTESGIDFDEALAKACHVRDTVEVDLMIRPGGEKRLSDFLLWESAYAELIFSDCLWPDFTCEHLADALTEYRRRQRRYGGLTQSRVRSKPVLEVARG